MVHRPHHRQSSSLFIPSTSSLAMVPTTDLKQMARRLGVSTSPGMSSPYSPAAYHTDSTSSLAARNTSSLEHMLADGSPYGYGSPYGSSMPYDSSIAMSMGSPGSSSAMMHHRRHRRSGHSAAHRGLKHRLARATSK